jgi:hypothetical protein
MVTARTNPGGMVAPRALAIRLQMLLIPTANMLAMAPDLRVFRRVGVVCIEREN